MHRSGLIRYRRHGNETQTREAPLHGIQKKRRGDREPLSQGGDSQEQPHTHMRFRFLRHVILALIKYVSEIEDGLVIGY